MADDKSDTSAKGLTKAQTELSKVQAPFEIPEEEHLPYEEREPEKVIPNKGDDGYDTPSGYALAKVGEFKGNAADDPEAARAHGLKYLRLKVLKRWGFGGTE